MYVKSESRRFPEKLKGIKPPIAGLWYKGNWELVGEKKIVAIVGSRRMSRYGKQVLAEIVPRLVERGYVTVSGFMYGVDVEVHRLTVEAGGQTIGVFGWGIEAPIISENMSLYHKVIESKGLFISEFPPEMLGTLWSFPARNRIVVGLADLVIVIEAGRKSGSLNSAEWARKMSKPIYAVPGSIFSSVSEGCNWLLSQKLAVPLTMEFFHSSSTPEVLGAHTPGVLNPSESNLITHLTLGGPKSVNELARELAQPAGEVAARLTTLLLKGEVEEERGVWVVIK
jgi:DNA processing protein